MSANNEWISDGRKEGEREGGKRKRKGEARGKGREGGVQKETHQNVEGYYSLGNLSYLLYSYWSSKISPIKKIPFIIRFLSKILFRSV